MRRAILEALIVTLLGYAHPAFAQRRSPHPFHPDLTIFVGHTLSFSGPTIGGAFGGGGSIVRFEIEFAHTIGVETPTRPFSAGVSADLLVQSPSSIHGIRFYVSGGLGYYGETFGTAGGSGIVDAKNIGLGGKIKLADRVSFRLDYRLFVLGDAPDAARGLVLRQYPQRLVAGLNFVF